MVESSTSSEDSKMIKFEETEGDRLGTTDYFFHKIGDSVPLAPHDFKYDLQILPSRRLAVSERVQLIFVAHSAGFWMAKTKDVMESAKEIKAKMHVSSIQELSVEDVPIGKVDILALSANSSTLAASVGGYIHFFSVNSLLSKEQKPSSSCSISESTSVKDMQWIKKIENSYVVLSSQGKLYHGALCGPLKDVMENVDAVEWSVNGSLIVVARNHILSILSSKFRERLSMSLLFKSWVDDSDVNCIVKVLARKIHIQGVIKQVTDSQYWDCQKFSSELELKQQHILKVNQDVTSQLIELERHFNTLELNKFGENGGVQLGRSRRTQTRFAPSRHIQSLHSLHNTMTLQLAAAEQLS